MIYPFLLISVECKHYNNNNKKKKMFFNLGVSPALGYYCRESNSAGLSGKFSLGTCADAGYSKLKGELPPPSREKIFVRITNRTKQSV